MSKNKGIYGIYRGYVSGLIYIAVSYKVKILSSDFQI